MRAWQHNEAADDVGHKSQWRTTRQPSRRMDERGGFVRFKRPFLFLCMPIPHEKSFKQSREFVAAADIKFRLGFNSPIPG